MVSQLTMPESCSCYKYFDQIKMNILHVRVFLCVHFHGHIINNIFHNNIAWKQ